jgi:hypothetical protein
VTLWEPAEGNCVVVTGCIQDGTSLAVPVHVSIIPLPLAHAVGAPQRLRL